MKPNKKILLIISIALNLVLSIYIIYDYLNKPQHELDELSDIRMTDAEGNIIYFYRYNLGQVDEKVLEIIEDKIPTTIDSEGNVWIYFEDIDI